MSRIYKKSKGFTPLEKRRRYATEVVPLARRSLTGFTPLEVGRGQKRPRLLTGFTLVEIIIAVFILAFLTVLVVVLLDPADFFSGTRDARRISDLQAIDSAISMYSTEVGGSLRAGGTPYAVYISLPDSNNNCNNYPSLPSLTPPQKYICADQNNFRKVDENGWIQINFTKIPSNSLAVLPVDPINSVTGGMYYTLVTDGKKWELTSILESDKNKGADKIGGKDGGQYDSLLEIGSALTLTPSAVKARQ